MDALQTISNKLSKASVSLFYNPFADFEWPQSLQQGKLAFAPALSTLDYLPSAADLDDSARRRYWFLECINFFSLNVNGEKALMAGIAERLHRNYADEVSQYLHHFLDEENKHMAVFARFCLRYGKRMYLGKGSAVTATHAVDIDDLLFFGRVVIFEQIADHYNKSMMADQALDDTVRRIHQMHHQDEARHLAFGRTLVAELYRQGQPQWGDEKRRFIADYFTAYAEAAWREYYNPLFMRDAGIADAYAASRSAFDHPEAVCFRAEVMAPCWQHFSTHGILMDQ